MAKTDGKARRRFRRFTAALAGCERLIKAVTLLLLAIATLISASVGLIAAWQGGGPA